MKKLTFYRTKIFLILLLFVVVSQPISADPLEKLRNLVGSHDSVVVASPDGRVLFEKNAAKRLIPASTLKVLTAAAVLHILGSNFRFVTEFYIDPQSNLKVKGYGDPLLISEVLSTFGDALSQKIGSFHDLVLDDSYFQLPINIPGVNQSFQPYDAPNGALCVNFNTINFKRSSTGQFISAEPQTPLLPFVLPRIESSELHQERIILSHRNREATYYAGYLLRYFLAQSGIKSTGEITVGHVSKSSDRLLCKFYSPYSMEDIIEKLLRFSNNFIANQMLISAGAYRSGPPGTLSKGVEMVSAYLTTDLNLKTPTYVEGSGISRKNRISAKDMLVVLDEFEPFHHLMRKNKREYYKTGSLSGVTSRVGYIESDKGTRYKYVVFINTPRKTTHAAMRCIHSFIDNLMHR